MSRVLSRSGLEEGAQRKPKDMAWHHRSDDDISPMILITLLFMLASLKIDRHPLPHLSNSSNSPS